MSSPYNQSLKVLQINTKEAAMTTKKAQRLLDASKSTHDNSVTSNGENQMHRVSYLLTLIGAELASQEERSAASLAAYIALAEELTEMGLFSKKLKLLDLVNCNKELKMVFVAKCEELEEHVVYLKDDRSL
ncbi:hypothetical protein M8C21_007943 [Ambrosia artemisiifolia]|uniref:Uncharacterized protein n=1 Tax=Ambrosia artemisiifolia TaxID=4212 RepID=A0AAD5CQF4_AMBAR|nr:hypothetical protein M8C21_007943 [Ambrosia artemisiifolia]